MALASDFEITYDGDGTGNQESNRNVPCTRLTENNYTAEGNVAFSFGDISKPLYTVGIRLRAMNGSPAGDFRWNDIPLTKKVITQLLKPEGLYTSVSDKTTTLHLPAITEVETGNQEIRYKVTGEPDSAYKPLATLDNLADVYDHVSPDYSVGYTYMMRYLPKPSATNKLPSDWVTVTSQIGAAPLPVLWVDKPTRVAYNNTTSELEVDWTIRAENNSSPLTVDTTRSAIETGDETAYTVEIGANVSILSQVYKYPNAAIADNDVLVFRINPKAGVYLLPNTAERPAERVVSVSEYLPATEPEPEPNPVVSIEASGPTSLGEGTSGDYSAVRVHADGTKVPFVATFQTNSATIKFAAGSSSLSVPTNSTTGDSHTIQVTAYDGSMASAPISVQIVDKSVVVVPVASVTGKYTHDNTAGEIYGAFQIKFTPNFTGPDIRVNIHKSSSVNGIRESRTFVLANNGTGIHDFAYTWVIASLTVEELVFDVYAGTGYTVDPNEYEVTTLVDNTPPTEPEPEPEVTYVATKGAFVRDGATHEGQVQTSSTGYHLKKSGVGYNRRVFIGGSGATPYTGPGKLEVNIPAYATAPSNGIVALTLKSGFDPGTATWVEVPNADAAYLGEAPLSRESAVQTIPLNNVVIAADGTWNIELQQRDSNGLEQYVIDKVSSANPPRLTVGTTTAPPPPDPQPERDFRFYINWQRKGPLGPDVVAMAETRDDMGIFYEFIQNQFVTRDASGVDHADFAKFDSTCDWMIPDVNATGYASLDWELHRLDELKTYNVGDPLFESAIDAFLRIVRYAKQKRPNIKWGMYGIPIRDWKDDLRAKWNPPGKFDRLLSECDFVNPTVYMPYSDDQPYRSATVEYIEENIHTALEYKSRFPHLKVFAYVWERLHVGNGTIDQPLFDKYGLSVTYGWAFLHPEDFTKYNKAIKNYTAYGVQADGIFLYTVGKESNRLKKGIGEHGWNWERLGRPIVTGDEPLSDADFRNLMTLYISDTVNSW